MTKSELIDKISSKLPRLSRIDVEMIVNTIFDTMTQTLANRDRIEIRGFGSFVAKKRASRLGRNPRTGESVRVPQKHVPFFTLGKELRERINGAYQGPKTDFGDLFVYSRESKESSNT
jgi:integration host factor subunit beta